MQSSFRIMSILTSCLFTTALAASPSRFGDYENYSGSVVCRQVEVVAPTSIAEIQQAIRSARSSNRNIRVISLPASRSYSPVICPEKNGLIINVEAFDRLLSIDPQAMTARVQPGILLSELQSQLADHGFTFPVTPDYTGVSLAGAMATGAHHSSLQFPTAVGDWVEEMTLVDSQGAIRVLSGEELDTARVHLGLLGVIVELKVRLVTQSKLQYGFKKLPDSTLASEAVAMVRQHDYSRLNWFPNERVYFIDYFDRVNLSSRGESYNNSWNSIPELGPFSSLPAKIINSSQKLQCTIEKARVATWKPTYKAIDSDRSSPVGLFQDMIGGTCAEGQCAWDRGIKTRTVEYAIDLERMPEWTRDVQAIVEARKGCFPVLGLYLRFSAASNSALGEAAGRDTMMFEIHLPVNSEAVLEPSSDVYDEIVQMTLSKYQGRPHWGKNSLPYFLNLGPAQYPKWEAFRSLRQSIDPDGVFKSPFWTQIDSATSRVSNQPGCGVSRECICSSDSDCGPDARCESGAIFEDARVCRK